MIGDRLNRLEIHKDSHLKWIILIDELRKKTLFFWVAAAYAQVPFIIDCLFRFDLMHT